jgi:hypothetical protein
MVIVVKGTGAMSIDLSGISEGDPVALVAEPKNPHDPHAIRIEHGGRLVGYVDRNLANRIVAEQYVGEVSAVLPHPETGVPAGLRVSIVKVLG